jgi:hypothetical protein
MATDVHNSSEPSVTSLVTGIVHDAQELLKQQVALLKHEMREDLRKTRDAGLALLGGVAVAAVGGLMLCWMLAYLLHEVAGLSRWGSCGIVGGVFAVLGAILIVAGKKKFDSFNPLPDETAEALKENVQWIVKPK